MMDNYTEFKKFLQSLSGRPTLLLHCCCAPCSSHTILLLKQYFDITLFYSNDNIAPEEEFNKRLVELIHFRDQIDSSIPIVSSPYNPHRFEQAIQGYEREKEGSYRCYLCYQMRLKETCLKAKELGMDYFTTTLSISPYKKEKWINEIGYALEEEYQVNYLYSNFKKENGYQHSIVLSKEYHLYRQDYCGCIYSQKERRESHDRIREENQNKAN